MTHDSLSSLRGSRATDFFEPYSRLVQCLHPRAKGMVFYDASGNALWRNDAETEAALAPHVKTVLKEGSDPEKSDSCGLEVSLAGQRPGYLFWLRDEKRDPLALLGMSGKAVTGKGAHAPAIEEIEKSLRPVFQCLARELAHLRVTPSADKGDGEAGREQTEWIVEQILPLLDTTHDAESLRVLLGRLVERTDSALGAVIIPERSIRVIFEPSGWSSTAAREALDHAHKRVLTRLQEKRRALVFSRSGKDSERTQYRLLAAPILERGDQVGGYVVLLKSVLGAEFAENSKRLLERMASLLHSVIDRDYDTRTDLQSVGSFERAVRHRLTAANPPMCSLIYFDIRDFGAINEKFDAATGDRTLRRFARLLREPNVPPNTFSTRLEGGRFACLLVNRGIEEAEEVAANLREAAKTVIISRQSKDLITLLSGVAPVPPLASGLRDALIAARAAATPGAAPSYSAIAQDLLTGSDTRPIPPELQKPAASGSPTLRIAPAKTLPPTLLREALRENRLRLFAQPIRPVKEGRRVLRVELFPRIVEAGGRIIPARDFLAAAPDPDALVELDRWVLSSALDSLATHPASVASRALEVSMNISGRSLEVVEFHVWVREQLRHAIVPAERWLFEVPEVIASLQKRDLAKFAREVMSVGARIALDDVGSAGSDLVRLRTHGASSIKMDGSLVRDVATDARAQRLVESLTQWANAGRMDTVAEEVESEEVRARLAGFGIDYVQGYVAGKPQPLEEFLDELAADEKPLKATVGA